MPTTLSERRATNRPKRQKRSSPLERQMITPPELAREWGIDVAKVWKWIDAGELQAVDLSSGPGLKQRRMGITREAVADFIARRSTTSRGSNVTKPARAKR